MHYQELYLENQVLARGLACTYGAAWIAALLWSYRGSSRGLSLASLCCRRGLPLGVAWLIKVALAVAKPVATAMGMALALVMAIALALALALALVMAKVVAVAWGWGFRFGSFGPGQ